MGFGMMGCGSKTIKYILFFFNLVFALGGLALLVVGSILQWNVGFYNEFLGENVAVPSILLIIVGSFVFLIAFFGCCGSIKENRCMVITYSILVLGLFAAQMAGGILIFVYQTDFDDFLETQMNKTMYNYDNAELAKQSWDEVQNYFECCGVNGPNDWEWRADNEPESCECNLAGIGNCNDEGHFLNGCFPIMRDSIREISTILGAIAIAIAVIELISVIFACTLSSAIKKDRKR